MIDLKIQNQAMRDEYHARGVQGGGITFAVLDTGVKPVGYLKGKVQGYAKDTHGHGTFVAGQLIEWCPDAKIHSFHVGNASMSFEAVVDALKKVRGYAGKTQYIVNMSLSGKSNPKAAVVAELKQTIEALVKVGVPVFVAAGNDGTYDLNRYPSCFHAPICIGALNTNGTRAKFSVYHNEVDFGEWGVGVRGLSLSGGQYTKSGTSMACPNAAGKAGLILSAHKMRTGEWMNEAAVYAALAACSEDIQPSGKDLYTGHGYIDIRNAGFEDLAKEEEGDLSLLDEFIAYLKEQVKNHSIYVWGAQGQMKPVITEEWIKSRETSSANARRAIAYWKIQVAAGYGDALRAFDCSGLAMYWLQNLTGLYEGDMTANSLMAKCKKISREDLKKGDWVFRVSGGKAHHIGYVVDDALRVIEAKGRDDGVVERLLEANGQTYWGAYGRPEIFAQADISPSAGTVLRITNPLMRGESIRVLQQALNGLDYPCGTTDGVCGANTLAGVRAFVAAHREV